jgi:hypothetical protein
MKRACLVCAVLLLYGGSNPLSAEQNDWRLTPPPSGLSAAEQDLIGRTVCGEDGFEVEEGVLRCNICPEFTGNPGSREGLELGSPIKGRFYAAGPEWLLDTDGCESHNESFGGAILLGPVPAAASAAANAQASPAPTAGRSLGNPPKLIFYKAGFRVNDCLVFEGERHRNLLVCNESDMAQGEVIGHISLMEISRRGINRWRLLRWYDNSGSDMQEVLSVVPTDMRAQTTSSGGQLLQIHLNVLETTRERYDQSPEPQGETVTLEFRRTGQRFYPTRQTQGRLTRIGVLINKMLNEGR